MSMPASQRRILTKTEKALRVSDPGLASTLEIFGWLNRDEDMPRAEQLPSRGRLQLGLLLRRLAGRRDSRTRSLIQYATIWFYVLIFAGWVSWIVLAGATAHSAACPTAPAVNAAQHGASVTACKLTGRSCRSRPARVARMLGERGDLHGHPGVQRQRRHHRLHLRGVPGSPQAQRTSLARQHP